MRAQAYQCKKHTGAQAYWAESRENGWQLSRSKWNSTKVFWGHQIGRILPPQPPLPAWRLNPKSLYPVQQHIHTSSAASCAAPASPARRTYACARSYDSTMCSTSATSRRLPAGPGMLAPGASMLAPGSSSCGCSLPARAANSSDSGSAAGHSGASAAVLPYPPPPAAADTSLVSELRGSAAQRGHHSLTHFENSVECSGQGEGVMQS
jgi:hypothetical protein